MIPIADVIRYPVITEKSLMLANEENAYTFVVAPTANKGDVRAAVTSLLGVERILSVRMVKLPRKKRVKMTAKGRMEGHRPGRCKAIVRVAPEESLMEHFQPG